MYNLLRLYILFCYDHFIRALLSGISKLRTFVLKFSTKAPFNRQRRCLLIKLMLNVSDPIQFYLYTHTAGQCTQHLGNVSDLYWYGSVALDFLQHSAVSSTLSIVISRFYSWTIFFLSIIFLISYFNTTNIHTVAVALNNSHSPKLATICLTIWTIRPVKFST